MAEFAGEPARTARLVDVDLLTADTGRDDISAIAEALAHRILERLRDQGADLTIEL